MSYIEYLSIFDVTHHWVVETLATTVSATIELKYKFGTTKLMTTGVINITDRVLYALQSDKTSTRLVNANYISTVIFVDKM